jgi:hypothetical protein
MNPLLEPYLRSYQSYAYGTDGAWTWFTSPKDEGVNSVSYGDIHGSQEKRFLELPYATWSDYSGGTVERSNCRVFLEMFEELQGKFIWKIYGEYDTTGVLIDLDFYNNSETMQDIVERLFNYPLIDEDDHSNLEMEIEEEAWDLWIEYDLKKALESRGIEPEGDSDDLRDHFYRSRERANEYPIFEDAVSCYVDINKIVDSWKDIDEPDNI